jgi:hypothetical protein
MAKEVVTPPCTMCGRESTVVLTDEEFTVLSDPNRPLMQRALPGRDADFRELLMSGTHPECWDKMLADMGQEP